jgi:hypothetical protein
VRFTGLHELIRQADGIFELTERFFSEKTAADQVNFPHLEGISIGSPPT